MNDFAISTSTGNRAVLQGLPARLVSDGLVTDEAMIDAITAARDRHRWQVPAVELPLID